MKMETERRNSLVQWGVPDQIDAIKEDLGPCGVFDFMGKGDDSCKQTWPEPGATTRHTEDQKGQGLCMDAGKDDSSVNGRLSSLPVSGAEP